MGKPNTMEVCRQHLFDDDTRIQHLGEATVARLKRIRKAYNYWNDFPSKKPKEIVDLILKNSTVEKWAAYQDVRIIQELLGDINKASKDWHRFKFNAMIQKAYSIAELKNDSESMTKAANTYAKFNKLDQEDATVIPWEDIIPQLFEPTEDPTVLGIKPIPNIKQRIAAMKQKYEADIEDISYEDLDVAQAKEYASQD